MKCISSRQGLTPILILFCALLSTARGDLIYDSGTNEWTLSGTGQTGDNNFGSSGVGLIGDGPHMRTGSGFHLAGTNFGGWIYYSGTSEFTDYWFPDGYTVEVSGAIWSNTQSDLTDGRLSLSSSFTPNLTTPIASGTVLNGTFTYSVSGGVTSVAYVVPPTSYEEWLNANFPPDMLSDPEMEVNWGEQGDADHDGIITLGEAYHGGNPLLFDEVPIDTVTFDATTNEYVFSWRKAVPSNGVEADSQWSLNLIDWYESGEGPSGDARTITVTPGPIEQDEQAFEARIPGASGQRIFFRLSYRRTNSV